MDKLALPGCETSFVGIIVIPGMTVLVGMIGVENDVILFSDGCATDKNGKVVSSDSIKTMRVNRECAVGIAGSLYHGNQVLANMARQSELVDNKNLMNDLDLIRTMNWKNLNIRDMDYVRCKNIMEKLAQSFHANAPMQLTKADKWTVVLGGLSQGQQKLCTWSSGNASATEVSGSNHNLGVIATPEGANDIDKNTVFEILRDDPPSLRDRIRCVVRCYALACPTEVNENITIRRLSDGFVLHRIAPFK